MSKPANPFDRDALMRARQRAQAMQQPALFLHDEATDEVRERLSLVNKSFTAPAVVTGWAQKWSDVVPGVSIVADTETLALQQSAHDLVIHGLSLHWAHDPVGQIIQCRRALRPDGLFMAVLFGGQTLHELRAALAQAESEVTGGLSPRVAPMAEIRDLGALLQRAGLALPVADSLPLTVEYQDLFHLMHDLRAMGEVNAMAGRLRHATRRAVFLRAAEVYAQAFPSAQGIRATFELIHLAGWCPDASQPQPLRPGSAQTRLADALQTAETKLQRDD